MTDLQPLIQVQGVEFSYGAQQRALKKVDLSLPAGEFVALAGANGSGKTTLAKHLNGLLRPDAGRVLIAGEDIRDWSIGKLARRVGYVFQNPDHQIFLATVEQEIAYGPRNLGLAGAELAERVEESLERFDLGSLRDRHPTLLGRGLRRKVALAAVYAMHSQVLVLDEPTGGLDQRATDELLALLTDLVAGGHTIVLITHDMRLVGDYVPRLVVMRQGQIIADGPTEAVMCDQELLRSAGIRPPQVARLAAGLASFGMPPTMCVDHFCDAFTSLYRESPRASRQGQRSAESP